MFRRKILMMMKTQNQLHQINHLLIEAIQMLQIHYQPHLRFQTKQTMMLQRMLLLQQKLEHLLSPLLQ